MGQYQVLGAFSTFLAGVSVIVTCLIAICAYIGIKMVNKKISELVSCHGAASESSAQDYHERKFLLQIVANMAICDFSFALAVFWKYLGTAAPKTVGKGLGDLPHSTCVFLGFWEQFWAVASIVWNCILVLAFFRVSYGASSFTSITKETEGKRYICIVLFIASICSLIPLIFGAYGFVEDSNGKSFDCWIKTKGFQLFLYVPALSCGLIFMFCLCYIFRCARETQDAPINLDASTSEIRNADFVNASNGNLYRPESKTVGYETKKYVMWFSFIFCFVWTFPAVERIVGMSHLSVPVWMVYAHDLLVASVGWVNGIFWYNIIRSVYAPIHPQAQCTRMIRVTDQFEKSYEADHAEDGHNLKEHGPRQPLVIFSKKETYGTN